MSHNFNDLSSLPRFTESPDDELKYFFDLSRALLKQRLAQLRPGGDYGMEVARLRLLNEMIIEQLPALSPEAEAK